MLRFFLARLIRKYKQDYQKDIVSGRINPNVSPNLPHFLGWLERDEHMYKTGLEKTK